ncbi:MAG: lytic transglycosylase domain-containing protein [Bacteroidota bacterium]|nr:lytic transglycosylase domain-containing protein [Bacteroidota bacterium]
MIGNTLNIMNKNTLIGIILLAITMAFCINAMFPLQNDEQNERDFHNAYKIYNVPLPVKLDFAGEEVPMEYGFVHENLEREITVNTYWASATLLIMKRANRYLPLMEPVFKKYGVPEDMAYIAMIESQLANVISNAAAVGFWQFTRDAAVENGLEVSTEVDERYNVINATEAACKVMKASRDRLGSWTLAAAAYNAGRTRIITAVTDQNQHNFYHLYLNDETSRYIYRILALKIIMQNPQRYGFNLRNKDLYAPIPTEQIKVNNTIPDLNAFAIRNGVSYKTLKDFNPWLRQPKLTNKDKNSYTILLPKPGFLLYKIQQRSISKPEELFNGF